MSRDLLAPMLPFMTVMVAVFGACVGSFLNVCIWRLPRDESLVHPGSHCPRCNHAIRPWENIPVVSWILLRGRCSNCRQPISVRYPLIELAAANLFLLVWWRVWSSYVPLHAFWGYAFLAAALLAAAIIDVEHMIIPNEITFTGMAVAVGLAAAFPRTRLWADLAGPLSGEQQLALRWTLDGLAALGGPQLTQPRLVAILDAVLGAAVGYTLLWALLEAGKRLWGRTRHHAPNPVDTTLTNTGITAEGNGPNTTWEDLFFRPSDRLDLTAQDIVVHAADPPGDVLLKDAGPACIRVADNGVRIGAERFGWDRVESITARVSRWTAPREIMGYGDVKLLAMIGAFLGADACVFVLLIGSMLGCITGTVLMMLPERSRTTPLPFGPFLAAAALLWLLAGAPILAAYHHAMLAAATPQKAVPQNTAVLKTT